MDYRDRITVEAGKRGGKPCIRGHRIWVSLILDLLAAGSTVAEILESYPGLTEEDIRKSWHPALEDYKKRRKKYLLYRDFE